MDATVSLSSVIDQCIEEAIRNEVIPGAALLVSSYGEILHRAAYGKAHLLPEPIDMSLNTLFDVSSLTKVMATTTAIMNLVEGGRLSLEDRVSKHIPAFKGPEQDKLTIADLLSHGSGLPAYRAFHRELREDTTGLLPPPGTPEAREYVLTQAARSPLIARRGASANYSDINFILLTDIIERVTGCRLDQYCATHLFNHLELDHTFFIPLNEGRPRAGLAASSFAATEFSLALGRYLVGEVHDDNAHVMGGVSGHAGLFSTLDDVHRLGWTLLQTYLGEGTTIFSTETLREFWSRRVFPNGVMRAYGWDTPSQTASMAGRHFSNLSFGHLGFTGTSIWIDAARGIIVVFLTNRVHPTRDNNRIRELRPRLHDLIMERIVAERLSNRTSRPILPEMELEADDMVGASYLESAAGLGQNDAAPRLIPSTSSRGNPDAVLPAVKQESRAVWAKCKKCRAILYRPDLERNAMVCPSCGFHHYLPSEERARLLVDEGTFEELDRTVRPMDPLEFVDSKPYKVRLKAVQKKTGRADALVSGRGLIAGHPVYLGVFDFSFMGGSMGSVVGEKVTRVFERALDEKCGAIIVSASGGARMQEGVLSLMQMAKSCAALSQLKSAGLPYISILCHPTTGGVAASFAMLGDVNIAEPEALIGFAGPRVIEQTIRQKLPPGFQRAEFLLEHGMLDMIVPRHEMKETVRTIYTMLIE